MATRWYRLRLLAAMTGLLAWAWHAAAEAPEWLPLLEAYATRPQDYPAGKGLARPDLAVPFRWHGYHEGAIDRWEPARMLPHAAPYDPLEGEGATADPKNGVRVLWVAEHRTEGKQALRADFPAEAIAAGKALVRIHAIAGGPSFSEYLRKRGLMNTASCYGPHYRWIKLDAFNPTKKDVRIRVVGVPFVLPPGASTVAVKTTDAVERGYACVFNSLPFEVVGPREDLTLFVDHVRMEQEVPEVISRRGRLFQFAARSEAEAPPVVWPGFAPVEADTSWTVGRGFGWTKPRKTRLNTGHSFRSMENGILWGRSILIDSPFRVDLPNGRYGVYLFAAPGQGFSWPRGGVVRLNGREQTFLRPHDDSAVRRLALGGEWVDYRPGLCVWEALVRPAYYPPTTVVYADVTDKHLLIELPPNVSLHALMVFPEEEKEEALREIGRWHFLLAESWDVSHPWVKGRHAEAARYIGCHDEMAQPETIPGRLKALALTAADFERGFRLFVRGLTEQVYPDSIPTPAEASVQELTGFAAPGERECVTFGFLPLRAMSNLQVQVSDLIPADGSGRIAANQIDLRISRYHQKTMQYGHHNHDYNYQEHYLVRRPHFDLHPGAARRVYLDIAVPGDARPGKYAGQLRVTDKAGKTLAPLGITLEVLPLRLEDPPVHFASSLDEPALKDYGFNTFSTSFDRAAAQGYRGYLSNCGYGGVLVQRRTIGWSNFIENKPLLAPLVEAGRDGKEPRGFFGGPAPGTHGNPKASEVAQKFFAEVAREFPGIDLPGRSFPVYFFRQGKQSFQVPHEWIVLAGPAMPDDPKLLEQAQTSGREFWYIDGIRHSKEQAGRFTFGLWIWRLGAKGRFTTLEAHLQYGGGTARESYRWEPYFTLLDVTTCNVDRAWKESLVEGAWNPCRDLVLLREGIDDYRYLHTLERHIAQAEKAPNPPRTLPAARKFLADLRSRVSLDLASYYEARSGAYGENWYMVPGNPWNTAKLNLVRREAAELIIALRKEP